MSLNKILMSVRELTIEFDTERGRVQAVDKISFDVLEGEFLGLVGESGCGKSLSLLAIMGLISSPSAKISGSIKFEGVELVNLSEVHYRKIRGNQLSIIFQDPVSALNPTFRISTQMIDVIRRAQKLSRKQAKFVAIELLESVGILAADQRINDYPHQLSGGMCQRVLVAMALSCKPKLLLADEPTTALDVTTQAQVLEQIRHLQDNHGTSVILATHDLGVVAETCQSAIVMYAGRIAEQAPVIPLFASPRHPYTAGLLASIPRIRTESIDELPRIPGSMPDVIDYAPGCRFAERCSQSTEECVQQQPPLKKIEGREFACFNPMNVGNNEL